MLRRKAYDRLMEWKSRPDHKCLLVKGQRQVGKTFIIMKFGEENYDSMMYVNLSNNELAKKVFDGNLDVETILSGLSLVLGTGMPEPGRTLIFLDEIQEHPRARGSLKQFTLDGRYDVIASGSLIDAVEYNDRTGTHPPIIPVGYEEHLTMYSLDFEEFLWAAGVQDSHISKVRGAIKEKGPVGEPYLSIMKAHFRDFMIVGGMPEAVDVFMRTKDYIAVAGILSEIEKSNRKDIEKYNSDINALKNERCYNSIPSQLGETNKRFTFSRIDGDGSRSAARKYRDNLLWIERSGIGNLCHSLRAIEGPLIARMD